MAELNTIIEAMEHGGISLEQAMKHFEQGTELIQSCQTILKAAEQKVQILTTQSHTETLSPYNDEEE